jgi:hypothetical protein
MPLIRKLTLLEKRSLGKGNTRGHRSRARGFPCRIAVRNIAIDNGPCSTEAAIPPNRLYLMARKGILASAQWATIRLRISPIRQNRHFFATVERIIAPISIIFGTNCQGQTCKGKLKYVAMFLITKRVTTSWVLRTFGEGCPKVYVIRAVMQLTHFLGYCSNNFFTSMR